MSDRRKGHESAATNALARARTGVLYALAAFVMWGLVVPLHFKLLAVVPAFEILAHRIIWASVFAIGLIIFGGQVRKLTAVLLSGQRLAPLCLSAAIIGVNWLVYIWAVNAGHLVQVSLGYFVNPLVNVALGILFLGERLRPAQVAACLLAAGGVLLLAASSGELPWVALILAFTFGFYGLIRKIVPVDPLVGFCVESLVLAPLALAFMVFPFARGQTVGLQGNLSLDLLLLATGLSTAAPLIWFAAAAQRLKLSTLGLLQYLAPSGQLALGVFFYGEPFGWIHALAFAAIWTALVIYTVAALRS